jgi:hypothetical protein
MNSKTLSEQALKTIQHYSQLTFGDKKINCPYFNNRRSKVRAGLRVMIGKGNPEEIVDEANLFALREKINLKNLSGESLKQFLVDHNLGVDCSAFAYYVLAAEYAQKCGAKLSSRLHYPHTNILRKLLIKLRPVENIGVPTLGHERNSSLVEIKDVLPGDLVIVLNAGKEQNVNHVLVVYKVEYENDLPTKLFYAHSFAWSIDGKYNHGIKSGTIEITDISKSILEQIWTENGKRSEENETYLRAREAQTLQLKRLF